MEKIMEELIILAGLLGICCIGAGFIIGAFLLHWVFGIIVTGTVLVVLAAIMHDD